MTFLKKMKKNEEKDADAKQHNPSKSEKIKKKRARTASTSESEEEKPVQKKPKVGIDEREFAEAQVPLCQSRKEHADKRVYNTYAVPPTPDPRRP